jgi:hypothetical protein
VITHIDVSSVLRRTVCELYSNLVTRPTGAAVRTEIEHQLDGGKLPSLTVIDFAHVGLLDFSCADEVVAKLLLRYCGPERSDNAYFIFRGVSDSHMDAIEAVLDRHGLALVVQLADGDARLVGAVSPLERKVWETMLSVGCSAPTEVAEAAGCDCEEATATVDILLRRRLVMQLGRGYVCVGGVA